MLKRDIQRMIGDLRKSEGYLGNLIPCGTFWVCIFPKDNKEQEAMLQNISDGIACVFQLQYFIPIALACSHPFAVGPGKFFSNDSPILLFPKFRGTLFRMYESSHVAGLTCKFFSFQL